MKNKPIKVLYYILFILLGIASILLLFTILHKLGLF